MPPQNVSTYFKGTSRFPKQGREFVAIYAEVERVREKSRVTGFHLTAMRDRKSSSLARVTRPDGGLIKSTNRNLTSSRGHSISVDSGRFSLIPAAADEKFWPAERSAGTERTGAYLAKTGTAEGDERTRREKERGPGEESDESTSTESQMSCETRLSIFRMHY